jgi:hypothetical protein
MAVTCFAPMHYAVADERAGNHDHDFDHDHDRDPDQRRVKSGATSTFKGAGTACMRRRRSIIRSQSRPELPSIPDHHSLENTPSLDELYRKRDDCEH